METQIKDLSYYLTLPYSILLTPAAEEDGGGWYACIPDLPGCLADGETQVEALTRIEDVKRLWLEIHLDHDDPVPEPALNPNMM